MFLASLLGDFMRQYRRSPPRSSWPRAVDPLQEGVDIVIMVGQPEDSTLVARRLLSTSRWLCASPDYLAAHGTPTSVAELAGHRAVLLSTDSQRYWPLSGDSLPCLAGAVLQQHHLRPRGGGGRCRHCRATGADLCRERGTAGVWCVCWRTPLPVGELYAVYPRGVSRAMKVKAFLDFPDQPPAGRPPVVY